LFKDVLRELGVSLECQRKLITGILSLVLCLAIRIIGEVTKERIKILQHADDILFRK
jgi:GMP synthase PP-ATPase subunit